MNWDQLHVILDITATVGGAAFVVVGYLMKNIVLNSKIEILAKIGELSLQITGHEGTCNAERAELYRITQNMQRR